MRLFVLLFCLISTASGLAQEARVLFKFAPLAMLDEVSFPTVQAGVEVSLSPKTSWYNEFGFRYRKTIGEAYIDTHSVATNGFKIKSEFRYYFDGLYGEGAERLWGYYLGVNMFYTKTSNDVNVNYYYQMDSSVRMSDFFGVRKKVWGANFIIGKQSDISKRFWFDIYVGMGARVSEFATVNQDFDPIRDQFIGYRHPNVNVEKGRVAASKDGGCRFNFTFGIRYAYKFR